jgi:hypothetical protein
MEDTQGCGFRAAFKYADLALRPAQHFLAMGHEHSAGLWLLLLGRGGPCGTYFVGSFVEEVGEDQRRLGTE